MKNNPDNHGIAKALALVTQLGFSMAGCVVIGVFVGKYLDGLFGTTPWCIIVFAFIGSGAGFKVLYDTAKDWDKHI